MKRLVYQPAAVADVRAAFEWYERQREGLGDEFLAALARAEEGRLSTTDALIQFERWLVVVVVNVVVAL